MAPETTPLPATDPSQEKHCVELHFFRQGYTVAIFPVNSTWIGLALSREKRPDDRPEDLNSDPRLRRKKWLQRLVNVQFKVRVKLVAALLISFYKIEMTLLADTNEVVGSVSSIMCACFSLDQFLDQFHELHRHLSKVVHKAETAHDNDSRGFHSKLANIVAMDAYKENMYLALNSRFVANPSTVREGFKSVSLPHTGADKGRNTLRALCLILSQGSRSV
ncbi:hypothetical protein PoB_000329000 [Plakobranchus ocellatus]|uniref:Uncharacterized protein n=1 Tax=Plakobranchus ocellatus TaxID=259542 RepID=A0AAV3Y1J6_9GAST|nr:hypothetical protein PoB_000329000 [Plakobranchus ocellatus]